MMLLLSFLLGFIIDIFSNSYGIHSFASVLIAYLKIISTFNTSQTKDGDDNFETTNSTTPRLLASYLYFITIHHFTLFFLERSSFNEFFSVVKITLIISVFTFVLFIIHQLFNVKKI